MDFNGDNAASIDNDIKNIIKILQSIVNDVKGNKSKDSIISQLNFSINLMNFINEKVTKELKQASGNVAPPPLISNNSPIMTLNVEDGKYIGEVKNGVPDGRGKLIYGGDLTGDIYEGDFKNGEPDGKGKYCHRNGNIYEGDMVKDKANGRGIFYFKDGRRFEGEFKADSREGKGIFYFPNGDRMMGDYHRDKPIGIHVTLHSNGEVTQKKYT